jgi:uncharacterized protein
VELIASQTIQAPPDVVWTALNDPAVLKACIPGADTVEQTSPTEFAVGMTAAVGPVKAKFRARLTLSDVVPPRHYTVTFDGQGGPAGYSKGTAHVELNRIDAQSTLMSYRVKAQIGGKLAQVGQRLIDAAARKVADEFFGRFRAAVEAVRADPTPPLDSSESTPATLPRPTVEPRWPFWVVSGLLATLVLMGWFATR